MAQISPFGTWRSPWTSETIVAGTVGFSNPQIVGGRTFWLEARPMQKGRQALVVKTINGSIYDLLPDQYNVRSRIHEYGGGAYLATEDAVYFTNYSDQQCYRLLPTGQIEQLTDTPALRFADYTMDLVHNRLICICEDHSSPGDPQNYISAIALDARLPLRKPQRLVCGSDFYAYPRIDPTGKLLSWISWNHPAMPWNNTRLWIAAIREDASIEPADSIAGSNGSSIFQPAWGTDGKLYYVDDSSGWWNLYCWDSIRSTCILPMQSEFGRPLWTLGMRTFGFYDERTMVACHTLNGIWHLSRIDTLSLAHEPIALPLTQLDDIAVKDGRIVLIGSYPAQMQQLGSLELKDNIFFPIKISANYDIDLGYISTAEAIAFDTFDGSVGHAFYYSPVNRNHAAPENELSPLLVKTHGGPTAAVGNGLNPKIQYWTSRGFAVVDVNYGGSTGFGRAYRDRLKERWGIVDVEDCKSAVAYLILEKRVDPARIAIEGISAGGYTTLSALAFSSIFKAGACMYGVSDLTLLLQDTHKFESRDLDWLIGPYPQCKERYLSRSPIYNLDRISCPVIFFHGDEDRIVPPAQSEKMYLALKAKGIPVSYLLFVGEQHGFKKTEHIRATLDLTFHFFGRIFGFTPYDTIESIKIENL